MPLYISKRKESGERLREKDNQSYTLPYTFQKKRERERVVFINQPPSTHKNLSSLPLTIYLPHFPQSKPTHLSFLLSFFSPPLPSLAKKEKKRKIHQWSPSQNLKKKRIQPSRQPQTPVATAAAAAAMESL